MAKPSIWRWGHDRTSRLFFMTIVVREQRLEPSCFWMFLVFIFVPLNCHGLPLPCGRMVSDGATADLPGRPAKIGGCWPGLAPEHIEEAMLPSG